MLRSIIEIKALQVSQTWITRVCLPSEIYYGLAEKSLADYSCPWQTSRCWNSCGNRMMKKYSVKYSRQLYLLRRVRQFSKQQCTIAGLRLYLTSTETPLSKYCLRQQIPKNWKNDAVLPRIIIYYLNGRLATDDDPFTVVCVVFTGIARHSWTGISFVYTHFNVFRQLITSSTITKMSIRIILIRSVIN